VAVILLSGCHPFGGLPLPPPQPGSGPGGADYPHGGVTRSVHGEGADQYWVFEPANPVPDSAPVVVFNHGWGAMGPVAYQMWIDHIVRKGNIVIYPRYQANLCTPSGEFTGHAVGAVLRALAVLQTAGHVRPQLDRFAIVGHSVGGLLTANMAATAASVGLPAPKAVMCVQPGLSGGTADGCGVPLEDLGRIPPDVLLLVVVGDEDRVVGEADGKRIFDGTPQIPSDNRDYVRVRSDLRGCPPLVANHFSPASLDQSAAALLGAIPGPWEWHEAGPVTVDALDYYGYWKLFDALCDAAFYGTHREYALGDTAEQRFMGLWSDGVPVTPLGITDNP